MGIEVETGIILSLFYRKMLRNESKNIGKHNRLISQHFSLKQRQNNTRVHFNAHDTCTCFKSLVNFWLVHIVTNKHK